MKIRQGVFLLIHFKGKYLIAHNVNHKKQEWRIPGGGKEGEETTTECFYREVYEELGLTKEDFTSVRPTGNTYKYEWPKELQEKYNTWGQEKEFVIATIKNPNAINLNITNELDAIQWVTKKELLKKEPEMQNILPLNT